MDLGAAIRTVVAGVALSLPAAVTGLLVGPLGFLPSVVAACVVGVVGGTFFGVRRPEAPVLALMAAAILLGSPIIPPEGRYLPSLACMIATSIATGVALYRGRPLQLPSRPVLVVVAIYFAIALLTTLTSIDPGLSLAYLGGLAASLGIAFVGAPTLLSTPTGRLAFVAMAGALGVALAAVSVGLWLVGPVTVFHEPLGIYFITELRVGDVLTGVIVPRASGPYVTPGYQALNLSIGLFALLSIGRIAGRGRILINFGIVIVVLAILLTMTRGGWLVAAVGSLAVVLIVAIRSRSASGDNERPAFIDAPSLGSFVTLGLALILLLSNAIGADARYDLAVIRYGDAAAGTSEEEIVTGPQPDPDGPVGGVIGPTASPIPIPVRGGAESSSRGVIWSASLDAIKVRPVTGYGPGTNAQALAPYLTGENEVYRGLTSHSTWLRTAVEMGILGLASLIGVIVLTVLTVLRSRSADKRLMEPSSAALLASIVALVVGQSTETLLLGGLTYASFFWAMAMGLVVARPATWGRLGAPDVVPIGGPATASPGDRR
jgi:hypothetical protein